MMGSERVVYLGTDEMIKADDCVPLTASDLADLDGALAVAVYAGARGAQGLRSKVQRVQQKAGHK
jgi:hypothetical protein